MAVTETVVVFAVTLGQHGLLLVFVEGRGSLGVRYSISEQLMVQAI